MYRWFAAILIALAIALALSARSGRTQFVDPPDKVIVGRIDCEPEHRFAERKIIELVHCRKALTDCAVEVGACYGRRGR